MPNKITAWSYSRYSTYKKCPRKLKIQAIDKVKPETNYAMQRGIDIHKKAENVVRGVIKGMPKELAAFREELNALRDHYKDREYFDIQTEADFAITKQWKPTTYDDWNHVWCRANVDLYFRELEEPNACVIDYKTGKIYDNHWEQGELYSVLTFARDPIIENVEVEFWYLDQDDMRAWAYSRKDYSKLKKKWTANVIPMLTDTEFKPTPSSSNCRFCDYASNKGGQCEYNSKGRK